MWGAIIGDLAGSTYEYGQIKKVTRIDNKEIIIGEDSFFSDDTILTIAILDAIENDCDYEKYLKKYGNKYKDYKHNYKPYFKTSFSPGFIKWVEGEKEGNSSGNGAMMRISSIGYLFDKKEDVIRNSHLATIPSHNTEEAVLCAEKVALIIYYARHGISKKEIIEKLNIKLEYKPFKKFNTTCYETIDNCMYALFTANSFEESINKVISYGGDTDTNACIVGSMAEALYGIDKKLIEKAKEKIPQDFVRILDKGYEMGKNINQNINKNKFMIER